MQLSEKAADIFSKTLTHVDPSKIIPEAVQWNEQTREICVQGEIFKLAEDQPIYLIGAGKASVPMALAVESLFSSQVKDGIVISPDKYTGGSKVQVFKGSHPLPDKESLSSAYELISFLKKIPDNSFVFNLVSGGASSLFCLPAGNIEIEEIQEIYSLLIESGAGIHEINTVRKVFSAVKGGQMLQYLEGKQVVDLMISDISDDEIGMIGSGPSIAQEISATEAFRILKQYQLYTRIPHSARQFLAVEMDKELKDKNYRTTKDIERHSSYIIASASTMAAKAADIVRDSGFDVTLNETVVSQPVGEVRDQLLNQIRQHLEDSVKPKAIISYGEPTVQVTGDGLGGRNQELALRMAIALKDIDHDLVFLSAGTDGIDGPTDAAGAVVTNRTYQDAIESNINPEQYLANNDSYHFFNKAGGHLKPGPTGNNLMDLHIVLIE